MTFLRLRLSAFYVAIFLVLGAMLPYWPIWLADQGLSGAEIGLLTAIPILGKMIFSPVFAGLSDRMGRRKPLMIWLISASLIAFACFAISSNISFLIIVSLIFGIVWAPIMAFGDNITLLSTRETTIRYGRMRLWGSISFIVMSICLGMILDVSGPNAVYWAVLGAIAFSLMTGLAMPDVRVPPLSTGTRPVLQLLKSREFQIFMAAVALIHGSHALYYAFASLHWKTLGYSETQIGFLWAEAVFVEVILFLLIGRIATAQRAVLFLLIAAIACVVRWSIQSFNPGFEILLAIQALHALTYGAMHLGAVAYISQRIPLELSATAQSLYGAGAFGLGTGITMIFVGILYERFLENAFWMMTLFAVGGTILCLVLERMVKQTPLDK